MRAVRDCFCMWPAELECDGLGVIVCEGCGGDQCVCRCGGEMPCPGCDYCELCDLEEEERAELTGD
jgi:hypothetical protein